MRILVIIFVVSLLLLLPIHVRCSRTMHLREGGNKFYFAPLWINERTNNRQPKFCLSIGLRLFIIDLSFGGVRPRNWGKE